MTKARALYRDREDAGEILAGRLEGYRGRRTVVLAIPNGGVPVGLRVRDRLGADFGLVVVRKLHIPWNREAGFGAVAPDGTVAFNEPLRRSLGLTQEEEQAVIEEEVEAIRKRMRTYGVRDLPPLGGRVAILVDDGLASGYSMAVACRFVRARGPDRIVVAVPTASMSAMRLVQSYADEVVCPDVRGGPVFAVADAYERWRDLEDEEVRELLETARKAGREGTSSAPEA